MSTISASTTTTTAYKVTADTTGTLVLQTGATPTTAMTISSAQVVTFANQPTFTGGTANGVMYLNGSKAVTTGSALVFDGTNLGIGTSSPDRPLTVVSATSAGANPWNASQTNLYDSRAMAAGVGGTLQFSGKYTTGGAQALLAWIRGSKTNSTDTDFYGDLLLGARNGAIKFYTASTPTIDGTNQVVTIDVSGNLLMGTTSALGYTGTVFNIKNSGSYVGLNASSSEARVFATWDTTAIPMTFYMGGTERARIDSSGNLGLGVTPSAWSSSQKAMQVKAASLSCSTNGAYVNANSYYDGTFSKYINTGYATFYGQESGAHAWYTSASGTAGNAITFTQAMTLDASGNLLVGATSLAANERVLAAKAAGTNSVLVVQNTSGSGNVGGINASFGSNGNNTSSWFFHGSCTGIANYYLYGNGTSSFTSDQRKKKNIETTRDGYIDDLCRLRVVKYNWLNHEDGTPKELGLIAQEVEQVFPGLVQDDLTPDEDGVTYKTLKASILPFMLLKAIQEQQALITKLQADVAALKGAA